MVAVSCRGVLCAEVLDEPDSLLGLWSEPRHQLFGVEGQMVEEGNYLGGIVKFMKIADRPLPREHT